MKQFILKSYSIGKETKTPILWGHFDVLDTDTGKVGGLISPLVYLRRPKWVSEEDFNKVLDGVTLNLPTCRFRI